MISRVYSIAQIEEALNEASFDSIQNPSILYIDTQLNPNSANSLDVHSHSDCSAPRLVAHRKSLISTVCFLLQVEVTWPMTWWRTLVHQRGLTFPIRLLETPFMIFVASRKNLAS